MEVEDLKTKSKQLGLTVHELKESVQFNEEDTSHLKLENRKLQQDVCKLQTETTSLHGDLLKEGKCKFVELLEQQADNMNGGYEDHKDKRGTSYRFLKHQLKDSKCARGFNDENISDLKVMPLDLVQLLKFILKTAPHI